MFVDGASSSVPLASKIVLDHVMDNQSVLVLDTEDERLKQILHSLIDQTSNETLMRNITCTLDEIWNSKRMSHYNFTRTNVLAVIFLSTCTSLTVVLCMGWLAVLYYRRYKQGRIDRKLQMALAHAVRQVLDQTPMVTFEAKKNEQESSDDHPLCAICLETFINDEQIRKLRKTFCLCSYWVYSSSFSSLSPSLSCCLCRSMVVGTSELSTLQSKCSSESSPIDICSGHSQSKPIENIGIDNDARGCLNASSKDESP